MVEALEYSAISVLALILYALIDKVVIPLVKSKPSEQDYGETTRRIEALERGLNKANADLAQIGEKIAVVQAILERVEKGLF